jgi:hypothetical protein
LKKKFVTLKILFLLFVVVGCGSSDNFVFTTATGPAQSPPQPQPPQARDDAFQALGNATVTYPAADGVLINDMVNLAEISSFDTVGSRGGSLALNADGSLAYSPVMGFVGSETFRYTLTNVDGESTATITMTSSGLGWFVNNQAGATGDGSQDAPFDTLAKAVLVAGSGDTIYVARGDGSKTGMTGGLNLPPGVNLVGEGTGLILAQTVEPPGQAPIIEGPIVCGGDNLIKGLVIDGSADDLIVIDNVGNVTLQQNTLSGGRTRLVACNNVSGGLSIVDCVLGPHTVALGSKLFVEVLNDSTNATIEVTDNTFLKVPGLNVGNLMDNRPTGTSELDIVFSGNTALGTPAEPYSGVFYLDNTGSGSCVLDIDGNNLSHFTFSGIWAFATDGPVTGSVTNNIMSNVGGEAIFTSIRDGLQLISGNVVDNAGGSALSFYYDGNGGTLQILDNVVTNTDNGVYVNDSGSTPDPVGSFALRNNSFSTAVSSLEIDMREGGEICGDITGNSIDSDLLFSTVGGGTISVERLNMSDGGPLQNVNTFSNGAGVVENATSGTMTSAMSGACQIP